MSIWPDKADFIVVVGTPDYLRKYEGQPSNLGTFVAAEMELVNARLTGNKEARDSVLPLLAAGDKSTAVPPLLRGRVIAKFLSEDKYFSSLFDLLLTIYRIPSNESDVFDIKESIVGAD